MNDVNFEVRVDAKSGSEYSLADAREFLDILKDLFDIKRQNREAVPVEIVSLRRNCLTMELAVSEADKDPVGAAIRNLEKPDSLTGESRRRFRKVEKRLRDKGWSMTIQESARLKSPRVVVEPRPIEDAVPIVEETTISGRLFRVGGSIPTAQITDVPGYKASTIEARCSKEKLRQLAGLLYNYITATVEITWLPDGPPEDWEIKRVELLDFRPVDFNVGRAFSMLNEAFKNEDIPANTAEFVRRLRSDP